VLETQVLLAQIELNRAQTSLNAANGVRLRQESGFERLVGHPPPDVLALPPTPAREAIESAVSRAPEDRADLRSLRYATLEARAVVSQLQSRILWPTLDAVFQGGYIVEAQSGPGPDFRFPTYGISGVLSVPLFQTGDEWIQIRLQKQRSYIAAYQESLLRRQVGDDVRQAVARLETADKAIEIAIEQQSTAQKNYQAVSNQYKLGRATELDVVTAQGAVFEAESNRTSAQYERELATYQLLFAEGQIRL
jgi:outer membrane protein TolC